MTKSSTPPTHVAVIGDAGPPATCVPHAADLRRLAASHAAGAPRLAASPALARTLALFR